VDLKPVPTAGVTRIPLFLSFFSLISKFIGIRSIVIYCEASFHGDVFVPSLAKKNKQKKKKHDEKTGK
jgi:hypothetical protein